MPVYPMSCKYNSHGEQLSKTVFSKPLIPKEFTSGHMDDRFICLVKGFSAQIRLQ